MKNPGYKLELETRKGDRSEKYSFVSADGVSPKNSFRDAELALDDVVEPSEEDEVLTVQTGFGFLPVVLGDREGETLGVETSDRAYQLTTINIEENEVKNCSSKKVTFYSDLNERFDKITYAPRGYESVDVVKNRLGNLAELLKKDGILYVAGKKTAGINRYKDYLNSLQGENEKVTQHGKQRVYRYIKTVEKLHPQKFEVETEFTSEIQGSELEFSAREGLFSPDQLDDGTKLLLENIGFSGDEEVLDLACGYGIIGTFLKKIYGVELFLSDDSTTAIHYSEKNLEANGVKDYRLENSDCLDGFNRKFDAIVSNPPTHQGSGVTDELFEGAQSSLRSGGSLYLVYNQKMNYENSLSGMFAKTEVLAEEDNYRVLKAVK